MYRTTPSIWRFSAAIPRASGRSAISGARSATRPAPGSIIWRPARRPCTARRSRPASTWKPPSPSSARWPPGNRCACRCRWRNRAGYANFLSPVWSPREPRVPTSPLAGEVAPKARVRGSLRKKPSYEADPSPQPSPARGEGAHRIRGEVIVRQPQFVSGVQLQQPRRIAAQDQIAVGGRQFGQALDRAHGIGDAHVGGEVGPGHDAVGADLAHEVQQDGNAVRNGVEVETA